MRQLGKPVEILLQNRKQACGTTYLLTMKKILPHSIKQNKFPNKIRKIIKFKLKKYIKKIEAEQAPEIEKEKTSMEAEVSTPEKSF